MARIPSAIFLAVAALLIMLPAITLSQPMGGMGQGMGAKKISSTSSTVCPSNSSDTNVTVVEDTSYIFVNTTGCPPYNWTKQSTGNNATSQKKSWKLSANPIISTSELWVGREGPNGTINTATVKGTIGVAINGVAIYSDVDALDRDAYVYEGATFDECRGHASPDGTYHYHTAPAPGCVYNNTPGEHSPLWAFMKDSIPVYGELGDKGIAPTDLDECGGHVDTTWPFYHYHVPATLKPPYIVACLKGCIASGTGETGGTIALLQAATSATSTCVQATKQYNYTSLVVDWYGTS